MSVVALQIDEETLRLHTASVCVGRLDRKFDGQGDGCEGESRVGDS